jgi:hypothetical protein
MKNEVTVISACEHREDKDFEPMSKRLVYSIRTNGGKYKDVPIVMWHSSEAAPSAETQTWLIDKGCTVVEGQPLGNGCEIIGNKIVAASTPVLTDFVLWIDTDMYILDTDKFETLLDKQVDVAAVGPERATQRWAGSEHEHIWKQFYEYVGVTPPKEKFKEGMGEGDIFKDDIAGAACTFYYNSALVFFRTGRGFPEAWIDIAKRIRNSGIEQCRHNFTQTSLTIAVVKTADTYEQLPSTYNAYWAMYFEKSFDAAILHYQSNETAIRKKMGNDPRVKWEV